MNAEPEVATRPKPDLGRDRANVRELLGRRSLTGRRAFWPLVVGAAVFAATAGALAWATHGGRPTLRLDLEFSESACCSMQVWVNGATAEDITVLPIQWGRRSTYSVPLYTSRIHRLRMPIGESPGGTVTLRRIWISKGSETVAALGGAELRGITPSGATRRAVPGGVEFTVQSRYGFLDAPVALHTGESRLRIFLADVTGQPLPWLVALLLLGTGAAVALALASARQALLVLALGLTAIVVYGLPRLSWHLGLRDDVSGAVGLSSYGGTWKVREQLVLNLAALAALVIPAAVAAGARLHRRPTAAGAEEDEATGARTPAGGALPSSAAIALVVVPILLVALAAMPNLRAIIGAGRTVEYVPNWDSNNLIFWHYLIQTTDLVPLKDFLWLYGSQWLFVTAVPWGPVFTYLGYLSFWIYLAAGTYLALARFFAGWALVARFTLVTGFWLSVTLAGHVPFTTRYVAPIGVVLLFAALDRRDPLLSSKRVLFAVALLELTLFELAQAGYALVPIGFLLVLQLAVEAVHARARIWRLAATGALTVALPLAAAAVVLAATGQLGGTASYWAQFDAVAAGFAWPAGIDVWVTRPVTLPGYLFWAVPITIALGSFGVIARRGRFRAAHGIVIALGLLALMTMQKQVLRPPVDTQLWLPVVFGLVFWAAVETSPSSLRRWSTLAAVSGLLAALLVASGGYRKAWDDVISGPDRLEQSIGALAHQRDEFAADSRAQFVSARFAKFPRYRPVVEALRRDPAVRAGRPVWILGDDTPITMMLGRSWPYYFNDFYDTSAIAFQEKVLERLERTPPARVVWNFAPEAMVFDSVPHVVRVPLLFEWAVRHLAPLTRIGHFAILRPLRAGEAVPLGWWRQRIGRSVHLGRVPELATIGGPCRGGRDCGTYVVVELADGPVRPAEVGVPVTVDGLRFEVRFATSGAQRYVVPLDRLWFWGARPGARRTVGTADAAGARVSVLRRTRDPDVLY